jgi:hypothetical protein
VAFADRNRPSQAAARRTCRFPDALRNVTLALPCGSPGEGSCERTSPGWDTDKRCNRGRQWCRGLSGSLLSAPSQIISAGQPCLIGWDRVLTVLAMDLPMQAAQAIRCGWCWMGLMDCIPKAEHHRAAMLGNARSIRHGLLIVGLCRFGLDAEDQDQPDGKPRTFPDGCGKPCYEPNGIYARMPARGDYGRDQLAMFLAGSRTRRTIVKPIFGPSTRRSPRWRGRRRPRIRIAATLTKTAAEIGRADPLGQPVPRLQQHEPFALRAGVAMT